MTRVPGSAAAMSFHATALHPARQHPRGARPRPLGARRHRSATHRISQARVVAPAGAARTADASGLANKRAQREQDRRQDLRQDRSKTESDRQRQREQDRQADASASTIARRKDRAQEQGREGDWREFCTAPDSTRLPRVDLCIHGADPAPAGLDVEQPVELPSIETAMQETASLICEGDGQSGYRVQVLYVYPDNKTSQFDTRARHEAPRSGRPGGSDLSESAQETGAARNLRFVHDAGESCQPTVAEVQIPAGSITRFDTMIAQLRAQGYSRTDRIYLAFTDATSYCGVGTLWNDDRVDSGNWNYSGPSYSRVDAGCWTGMVAAHEVMHNLGGVQLSAPNASGGFHCIDEYDVMCYSDAGSGLPRMRFDCSESGRNTTRFDCGHNDYFHTNPVPGSYLATHWNAAQQPLPDRRHPAPPPPPATRSSCHRRAEEDKKDKKGKSKHGKARHRKKHEAGMQRHGAFVIPAYASLYTESRPQHE